MEEMATLKGFGLTRGNERVVRGANPIQIFFLCIYLYRQIQIYRYRNLYLCRNRFIDV